ncbi:MAG: hypothetical protein VX589_09705 [Myxococcota bacterium]|nr:hypothetical protein [Myxococcota bacterium]
MKNRIYAIAACLLAVGCIDAELDRGNVTRPSSDRPDSRDAPSEPASRSFLAYAADDVLTSDSTSDDTEHSEPSFDPCEAYGCGDINDPSEDERDRISDLFFVEEGLNRTADQCITMCTQVLRCFDATCGLALNETGYADAIHICIDDCLAEPQISFIANADTLVANECSEMERIADRICSVSMAIHDEWSEDEYADDDWSEDPYEDDAWREEEYADEWDEDFEPCDTTDEIDDDEWDYSAVPREADPACYHLCDSLFGPDVGAGDLSCVHATFGDIGLGDMYFDSLHACYDAMDNSEMGQEVCIYVSQSCIYD